MTWEQIIAALDSLTDQEKSDFVKFTKTNDYGTLINMVQVKIKSILHAAAEQQLEAIKVRGSLTLDEINDLIQ
jgi:hypothetical protein